jgi:hypothetical protein
LPLLWSSNKLPCGILLSWRQPIDATWLSFLCLVYNYCNSCADMAPPRNRHMDCYGEVALRMGCHVASVGPTSDQNFAMWDPPMLTWTNGKMTRGIILLTWLTHMLPRVMSPLSSDLGCICFLSPFCTQVAIVPKLHPESS